MTSGAKDYHRNDVAVQAYVANKWGLPLSGIAVAHDAILQEPLAVSDGAIVTPDRPGLSLAWDEDKVKRLDPV
jgi:hypothetical protein